VVTLAHSLGVPLVAEGIETPEQRAALTAMGCDQAQGYLFAKPMPAPDLEQFLITRSKAIAA
jgi:EAL domain-containing protein (putative c-di-GMP-specific phosphodiesterase class I)